MTYIETNQDGKILRAAEWKFSAAAVPAEREVVRGSDGKLYLKGDEPAPCEASAAEKVLRLEFVYQLPRPVRTALLLARARGEAVDAELMSRVDEIEALAEPLRAAVEAEDGHE